MDFDDIARVIGYLTIGWWVIMIIIVILVMVFAKSATVKESIAEYLSPSHPQRGGCRLPDGRPCRQ